MVRAASAANLGLNPTEVAAHTVEARANPIDSSNSGVISQVWI
jgi:hypothetical protein